MANGKQQDTDAESARQRRNEAPPDAEADALNDARALQQMIEGTADASEEFKRIEQKR